MSTLREAVESGRRWRHPDVGIGWFGPGVAHAEIAAIGIRTALSSCYEIEPEPEKPREIRVCVHGGWFHAVPPPNMVCNEAPEGEHRTYHDADACDRLKGRA